jgi:hypothetical protein
LPPRPPGPAGFAPDFDLRHRPVARPPRRVAASALVPDALVCDVRQRRLRGAAFANDQTGWAIRGILGVFMPFVGLPFLVYALFLNQEKFSRSLYIASILGWLFWIVVIVAAYDGQMPSISGQPLE